MQARKALITGITGQDGSYLTELLLSKGYEVHGIVRRVALEDPSRRLGRISSQLDKLHLHAASLESFPSIYQVFRTVQPDECYHLAAQSFVSYSFDDEFSTLNTNINGTHFVLAALKDVVPQCRFYFASSEMFGKVAEIPQTESTRFHPRSAYGISKVAGFDLHPQLSRGLRDSRFKRHSIQSRIAAPRLRVRHAENHIWDRPDSGRRIQRTAPGDAKRDWGHARDYVEAMWLMLQQDEPDDYVVATGKSHSVADFVRMAFGLVGLDSDKYVVSDPDFYRPAEVNILVGNAAKAQAKLGWAPQTVIRGPRSRNGRWRLCNAGDRYSAR